MITLHLKLQNEYLKLNDYMEQGNITWGKNGDDGVSVTLKNVPNGKNLLADSLGQELVAYRGGELAWKGFVSNVTENENGIEVVGRGDVHRLDYIEDFDMHYTQSTFSENWYESSAENSYYYQETPILSDFRLWVTADNTRIVTSSGVAGSGDVEVWNDLSASGYAFVKESVTPFKRYNQNHSAIQFKTTAGSGYLTYPQIRLGGENKSYYIAVDIPTPTLTTSGVIFSVLQAGSEQFEIGINPNLSVYVKDYRAGGFTFTTSGFSQCNVGLNVIVVKTKDGTIGVNPIIAEIKINDSDVYVDNDGTQYGFSFAGRLTIGAHRPSSGTPIQRCFEGYLSELLIYDKYHTAEESTQIESYLNRKYLSTEYANVDKTSFNIMRGYKPIKLNVDFDNRAYMSIPNSTFFKLFDAGILGYKVPDTSKHGFNFLFYEYEYRIPSGFSLDFQFFDKDSKLARFDFIHRVTTTGIVTNGFDSQPYVKGYDLVLSYQELYQFNAALSYNSAVYASGYSLQTFTNTNVDDYFYVNIGKFRSQYLPIFGNGDFDNYPNDNYNYKTYAVLNPQVPAQKNFELYTDRTTDILQGNLILLLANADSPNQILQVKDVYTATYSGIDATKLLVDASQLYNSPTNPANAKFAVIKNTTDSMAENIANNYLSGNIGIITAVNDDLSNQSFKNTTARAAMDTLAGNVNYRYHVTGGKFYFLKDPTQTYYLMQSSKNVSQSFDKAYTKVRTKFKSIYGIDSASEYSSPPNRYPIVKSKSIEQGTLSKALATLVAETVAEEDVRNVVKVIPQTGELYNEYGAVVRDPKINSAVVLKNVVPELIGLGDKTYYLSEITYDFMTGQYEYVVDEPEITFELILSRTQN